MPAEKVCVIGAGSSGIVACQVLNARRISFDCFEKGSQVGGNWRFENDNGMSSAYRSLHINTSRRVMAFKALPMPDHFPDYPNHFQMAAYFDEYVDHFGLREKIRFRTEVLSVEPVAGEWEVTVRDADGNEETNRYRAVLVANGHHWDPRWPEPAFPGSEEFSGEQIHVHHYREPDILPGKRVLVLGIGNSATDVAVESSRIADATFIAMRRGAYVLPKYINGKPIDETSNPFISMLPLPVQRFFVNRALGIAAAADMTAYGLPKPDHKLFEAHPTVSSELLPRLGHGDIQVKPNIDRFSGGRTRPLRRRQRGGDRPRRLLHRLQDDLPVLRPRRSSPPPTTGCRSTAGSSRSSARVCTSSASSSRWGRSCRWPRRRRNGSPTCSADAPRYRRRRRCGKRSRPRKRRCESASLPLSVIRSRSTSTPTCARSGASESWPRNGPNAPGPAARGQAGNGIAAPPP